MINHRIWVEPQFHTGTIPSKSLRETVMHLALLRQQTHGIDIRFKEKFDHPGVDVSVKKL